MIASFLEVPMKAFMSAILRLLLDGFKDVAIVPMYHGPMLGWCIWECMVSTINTNKGFKESNQNGNTNQILELGE